MGCRPSDQGRSAAPFCSHSMRADLESLFDFCFDPLFDFKVLRLFGLWFFGLLCAYCKYQVFSFFVYLTMLLLYLNSGALWCVCAWLDGNEEQLESLALVPMRRFVFSGRGHYLRRKLTFEGWSQLQMVGESLEGGPCGWVIPGYPGKVMIEIFHVFDFISVWHRVICCNCNSSSVGDLRELSVRDRGPRISLHLLGGFDGGGPCLHLFRLHVIVDYLSSAMWWIVLVAEWHG